MEQLWKDYMSFEQNINPIIAEKMAIERSRDYMNARRVAKELEAVTRGLNRSAPSVPPTGHPEEVKQVLYDLVLHVILSLCYWNQFLVSITIYSICSIYYIYIINSYQGRIMEEIYCMGTQ